MSKSIKLKNNSFIDSEGIVHRRTTLKKFLDHSPKLVYSDTVTSSTTREYKFLNESSIYIVIAHTNGGDCALFDIVMYQGYYRTRIHDNRYLTVVYDNNKITISAQWTTFVRIIELPSA